MINYDEIYFEIANIIADHFICDLTQATDAAKDITDLIKQKHAETNTDDKS